MLFLMLLCCLRPAAGQGANRLPNSGFEATQGEQIRDWQPFEKGYVPDTNIRHSGKCSVRCENATQTEARGINYNLILNQTMPLPLLLTGWSRARNVSGVANSDYALYVDLEYQDGTPGWGFAVPFAVGAHDWQFKKLLIFPAKPIRIARIYALFRSHSGTVWFDDVSAKELSGNAIFDSQPIAPPALPPGVGRSWFARDVAANSPLIGFQSQNGAHSAVLSRLGLRLNQLHTDAAGQQISGILEDTTGKPRAITLYYVERFDAKSTVWWNDIRHTLPANDSGERTNQVNMNAGATGSFSLYPFGCVTGKGKGLAIGLPPSFAPRMARIGYHVGAKLLYLAVDLGLTGENRANSDGKGHGRAPFGVVRYAVNPTWGFRDAAATFYHLFPDAYERRAKSEGIWIPFSDPSKLPNVEDFHIAYHEGDNSVLTDDRLGILSFRYSEPMSYWMPMSPEIPRTYAKALAQLQQQAQGNDAEKRHWAQAVLNSGSEDEQGHFNVQFQNAPWANGAVWTLNPNPLLTAGDVWTKARLNYTKADADKRYGAKAVGHLDGEYLDSLEGWADVLDFRPESLRASRLPPTFATDTFRPVLPTLFSVYEGAQAMRADLHRRGKLLMANSTPWRISAFAPLLDVSGTEINWLDGDKWVPDSDAFFNLRRTLNYHKPYLLLQNTDFDKFGADKVETYFRRCLFYGVYPSMFSANAATHPYWEEPRWYNRDRALFQKYIPLIQTLSRAGWEPLTYARSSNPSVFVERYGAQYFTLRNDTDTSAPLTLTLESDKLGFLALTPSLQITDLITGKILATVHGAKTISFSLELAPEQVCALYLQPTSKQGR